MFRSMLFLVMGLAFLGVGIHGVLTGGVHAFARGSLHELIRRDEDPVAYALSLGAHSLAAALFLGLFVFIFWSERQSKAAEERFFRQRDLLAPKED